MKHYSKTLSITSYFGNKIEVAGVFSEGIKGDRDQPDDPNEFEVQNVFENCIETDKFDKKYLDYICLEMCESDKDSDVLDEFKSNMIINTEKYLGNEERDFLEFLLLSEFGRAGNSLEKKDMIYEIARKCELIGLDKEFINELKL